MKQIEMEWLEVKDMGLSEGMAKLMSECAQYCLSSHNHTSGVKMRVQTNDEQSEFSITWEIGNTKNFQYSMNDEERTTDFGAMALSLLLTTSLTNYKFFLTSKKKTGFDFWLFEKEPEELDYTRASARLEISGIRKETKNNSLVKRLNLKRQQINRYNVTAIGAYISIIEFEKPESIFEWQL